MTTLYAAISTASDVVEGDYCDVGVTEAIVVGYKTIKNDKGIEEEIELLGHGGDSVLDPIELPIRTDDDDKLALIEQAAVDLLEAQGFRVTGPWELADNAAYAPVERIEEDGDTEAQDYEAVVEMPAEQAKYVVGRAQDEGGLSIRYESGVLHLSATAFGRLADGDNETNGYIDRAERLMWVGGLGYPVKPAKDIEGEPSVEVVWSVVDGASPNAHAVEPGPIGVTFPAAVQSWAEGHGLADDNDTVYVMVTLADEAGQIDGEIARMTALASPADADRIFNALHTEVTLYETNSDIVVIARGPRAWTLGPAVPEMAGTFAADAHAWLAGDWEPGEGDGQAPQELDDDFTAVAAYTTEDGVRLLADTDRIGGGARVYLGLSTTV